ncbi:T9SS type A sorting domain-containing protein [Winogradskyella flava]|uniref:T9SS type A sorting domain-containing protein n=1 Tax=Winogradskyella flava TaxID=1884876 RepID=A0A842IR19_9FLAO|nr:T9SS type A sorting domain-containing protein [Winogradskyella flava]MBC2845470.1 T9SS type A sorting domain-containing protein [Winogradskyella flava]
MKKITLMLLVMLAFCWQSNSQSIIIGTGTDDSGNTGSDPIDGYFNSFRYQVVYTAAELSASLTPFDEITALGWSISEDYAGGALLGYTIKMGHTSATNSAAHDASTTTIVRNAADYDPTATAAGTFDMITFDTNFVWNGVDNVLVEVCSDGQNPFSSPYGQVRGTSGADGSRRYRVDANTACGVDTNNVNTHRPNIQFNYIDGTPPACLTPANVASNGNPTPTTLGMTWTLEPNASDYQVEIGAPGFLPGTGAAIAAANAGNAPGVAFGTLTPETTYDMYVRSDCTTDGFSEWVGPITDTTLASCLPITNGSVNNVTDTAGGFTWTDEPNGSLGYEIELGASGFTPGNGEAIQSGSANQGDQGVGFTGLTPSTDYEIYIRTNCDTDGFSVWEGPFSFTTLSGPGDACNLPIAATVETDCSTATPTSLDFDAGGTETLPSCDLFGNNGYWIEVTAPANGSMNVYLGGTATSVGLAVYDSCGGNEVFCDNNSLGAVTEISGLTGSATYSLYFWQDTAGGVAEICFEEINCASPTALAATDIMTTSAVLSWTGGSETLWDIELVDITASGTATGTATASGVSNPYTQMSLVENNDYEFYVRADCGGTTSDWAGPFAFSTPCSAFVPDYLESFDVSVAPDCWLEAGSGDPTTGPSDFGSGFWNHDEFANIGSTNNSAQINLYTDNREDWLISPMFDLSGGSYELVYTVALTDFGNSNPPELNGMGSDDEVQVLISDDGGASWTNLITYNQSSFPSETGDVETFDLSAYTGNVQFAIWATDGSVDDSEDYDFFVDEFIVRTPLACTSAVVDSSTVVDDCGNGQFFVDVDITTVGDATQINDGSNTYAISGTGVIQVGPYTSGATVALAIEHSDVSCDFNLADITFNCPPVNDEIANAIAITVDEGFCDGTNTNGTNVAATDSGEGAGSCFNAAADDDVWFTFTVPAGTATVDVSTDFTGGTLLDSEIALYSGTSGSLVELACSQDEGTTVLSNGFSWNSLITDLAVTVGETYYVQVAGYNANTGTFCLDVSTNQVLGIDDVKDEAAFSYYPNPVKNTLTLSAQNTIESVTMYNMLGQEVLKATPNNLDSELDMSNLESGAYFVRVTIANITSTVRVIKQ